MIKMVRSQRRFRDGAAAGEPEGAKAKEARKARFGGAGSDVPKDLQLKSIAEIRKQRAQQQPGNDTAPASSSSPPSIPKFQSAVATEIVAEEAEEVPLDAETAAEADANREDDAVEDEYEEVDDTAEAVEGVPENEEDYQNDGVDYAALMDMINSQLRRTGLGCVLNRAFSSGRDSSSQRRVMVYV
eukprot:TRINITY_DN9228_c0_g1_i2.p1 TRINITY_DN9228_c0_g1~~TRINITY_DN9228_c0_g1_i2.p1  ORF type:complete len:186 (-),score=34.85 TRINITY_DN9228_c0_g1_i2:79-636(-)